MIKKTIRQNKLILIDNKKIGGKYRSSYRKIKELIAGENIAKIDQLSLLKSGKKIKITISDGFIYDSKRKTQSYKRKSRSSARFKKNVNKTSKKIKITLRSGNEEIEIPQPGDTSKITSD